ncbi:MAG: tryptophan-rich sensory protein [Clostridia bacterium]|nr:tryptophan-rich sensory protein [Clostridia bacterium]
MSNFKIYLKSILIPVLIGGIVGILISKVIDYNTLIKPLLAPPSILFPIVWTILYILMGISYGILKTKSLTDSKINQIYYTQLFINAFWPILFFYLKLRLFSFIWIILLDILIVIMIVQFYQKNKTAGLIQIPYLLWSLFATYLNFAIYLLDN